MVMLLLSAPSALASEGCPNEAVRAESNINPTTGQPYDMGLPECRAYEMVSPLEKQQHDALTIDGPPRISVSPEGSAIEWASQGAYAEAENYQVHSSAPSNPYVAQRSGTGWTTRSGYPPPTLIEDPFSAFLAAGVYSPNLASETVCGGVTSTGADQGPTIRCALRDPDGTWISTPGYTDLTAATLKPTVLGSSSNGEDIVFYSENGVPFVSADTSSAAQTCNGASLAHCGGIYEIAGIGTGSPELQLVNVDDSGDMIGPENVNAIGAMPQEPAGSDYQAISADGSKVFFTGVLSGSLPTIYARVDNTETVTISAPECEGECEHEESGPATYQGASLNGGTVFFTSNQQLLSSDHDEDTDLYEYDFAKPPTHRLVQVSEGGLGDVTPGTGANVQGVVSISGDGSHVYFVATGVLTTLPNAAGQIPSEGSHNLYAYDSDTGETKFVATLQEEDKSLWGFSEPIPESSAAADVRLAQTTPTGTYLVFDSFAKLITAGPEADTSGAQQVYRYDFQTGRVIRVSIGHNGFADNGNTPGDNAVIGPADDGLLEAASPTVNDSNRSISEGGETVVFVTAAQLQDTDVANSTNKSCDAATIDAGGTGCQVYVWHECPHETCTEGGTGEVSMISDGQDPMAIVYGGMSASGSDIFFQTRTQLVGQDTDELGDIYDARVDGGFPAPTPEPSCTGEACQGSPSLAPTFSVPGTQSFTGAGNQTPPPFKEVLEPETKPKSKPLTRAQKLARALKACRAKPTTERPKCERAARRKYGGKRTKTVKGGQIGDWRARSIPAAPCSEAVSGRSQEQAVTWSSRLSFCDGGASQANYLLFRLYIQPGASHDVVLPCDLGFFTG